MKKLVSLALVVMMLAAVPEHPVIGDASAPLESYVTGPVMCADGTLAIQEDECPERITIRVEAPDGTIYRFTCKLVEEDTRVSGVRFIYIPFFPYVIPIPEFTDTCDYGDCGEYDLDDLEPPS